MFKISSRAQGTTKKAARTTRGKVLLLVLDVMTVIGRTVSCTFPQLYHCAPFSSNRLTAQEAHRIKVLVAAVELSLEQATIVAVLHIFTSVNDHLRATSTHAVSYPEGTSLDKSADVQPGRADVGEMGLLPPRTPASGKSDDLFESVGMPMLPTGVTVALAIDVTAVCVILTDAGGYLAAATLSTAHCKINVSNPTASTGVHVF